MTRSKPYYAHINGRTIPCATYAYKCRLEEREAARKAEHARVAAMTQDERIEELCAPFKDIAIDNPAVVTYADPYPYQSQPSDPMAKFWDLVAEFKKR